MNLLPATSLLIGSAFGFLSVAFGAFGAHALKDRFDAYSMSVYSTGVLYQSIHALALVALGAMFVSKPELLQVKGAQIAVFGFTAGIVVFSGSLYALAFTGVKMLGAITPLGGLAFLVGWASLLVFALALRNTA